jgi:fructose-1-phosphate kinase PfkB-like protein
MHITILEFAPCADSIYHIRRDREEGYVARRAGAITIRSGAKLRPRAVSTYAGGKATNVARVMDRLLKADDKVEIELIVFRPDSPEGRYIHELQSESLTRVSVRPVIIKGRARFCIDLIDPATDRDARVEFNISPRALWEQDEFDRAAELASRISTDLLLLAGNPPVVEATDEMAVDLYSHIVEKVRARARIISIDAERGALASCLKSRARPDVIKINADEYAAIDESLWNDFSGTLLVTDAGGCSIWEGGIARSPIRVQGIEADTLYSTIGAGDAVHAGFTLARWVWGFDVVEASLYGQAAAGASVSLPDGTRGITSRAVKQLFSGLKSERARQKRGEKVKSGKWQKQKGKG